MSASETFNPAEELEACGECKWKYPAEILNPMFIATPETGGGYTADICGLCALEISNRVSGVTRKRFHGVMAEQLRQDAFHWRKKHPECKPVEVTNDKKD